MATFIRVQHNSTNPGSTATGLTATLGGGVTSGNLLVATIVVGSNVTVTPPAGWTQAGPTETVAGSLQTQIYYLVVSSGGATSWAWSWGATPHSFGWTVEEWNSSTGWLVSPVDSSAGATSGTTTISCGSPAGTTQASELWYGVLAWSNSGQSLSGVTANWVTGDTSTFASNNTQTSFYQTVSATGTPSLSATISASQTGEAGVVATFMPGAATGAAFADWPVQRGRSAPARHRLRRQQLQSVPAPMAGVGALTVTPAVFDEVSAVSGVVSSVTSFSPAAGSMVRIAAAYLDATDLLGKTFTCADSHSNSYALTLQGGDADGGCYLLIFDFTYVSAPGATTVTITCSNTAGADCLIQPYLITGQAANQSTAAQNSFSEAGTPTTTYLISLTTTQAGSQVTVLGAPNNANHPVPVPNANTVTDANWDDNTVGSHGVIGRSAAATVTPGATTFGWTSIASSPFGYGVMAAEILPATSSSVTANAGLAAATAAATKVFFSAQPPAAVATGAAYNPAAGVFVPVVDTAVTPSQVSAVSGVATSTTSFTPGNGSMVVVLVSYLFATNIAGTLTCKDSSGTAYTAGPQIQDTNAVGIAAIFTHQYASGPGAITVVVTCNTTSAADAIIAPRIVTGQDLLQTGAATKTASPSTATTALNQSVTTTAVGSLVYAVVECGGNNTLSAVSGTTNISLWNDLSIGDTGGTGRTTSTTSAPGATTVGWTNPVAENYGFAALEVIPPLGLTAHAGLASATGLAYAAVVPSGFTTGLAAGTGTIGPVPVPGPVFTGLLALAQPGITPGAAPGWMPAAALATGAAYQISVSTTGALTAFAQPALTTGAASNPAAQVTALPAAAFAAGVAFPVTPSYSAGVSPGLAAATGIAIDVTFVVITSAALTVSGFGTFPQVPSTAVILTVIANITQHGSDVQIEAPVYELWDGTSARIGTAKSGGASTSAAHVDSVVFTGVSYSQLATLQLRIYATSQPVNTGATTSVDAASLSVEWLPNRNASVTPNVLAVKPKFPAVKAATGVNAQPNPLAVTPVVQTVLVNVLDANVFASRLKVPVALPKQAAGSGTLVALGVLAVPVTLPMVIDVTAPGWATAQSVIGSGSGAWSATGNVTGSPDGNFGIWTAP